MTTNSKKIVLIGPMPPYRGGIARFTASLAEELLDMGHDVKVISYRKQYPKLLYPGKTEKDYSQNISAAHTEFLFSPLNLKDWNDTFNQIKCFQPDLVIYQWWTTFWAPATSWLPVYAERQTTALTLLSSLSDDHQYDLERSKTIPEFYKTGDLRPLCAYGIDYFYSGAKDPLGFADLAKLPNLLGNEKIKLIYEEDSIQVFKVCD